MDYSQLLAFISGEGARVTDSLTPLNMILLLFKQTLSFIGASIIFFGALSALYQFASQFLFKRAKTNLMSLDFFRLMVGRSIVLGLEFIVAADVIETTTVPDYYSVGILSILVVIRN